MRKDQLSQDVVRLVFQLPAQTSILGLPIGQHVAIRGYYDDDGGHHTVTRSYTPVSNNKDLGRLELVIKLYPDGQLTGKYLSKIEVGDGKFQTCNSTIRRLATDRALQRLSSVDQRVQ